MAMLEHPPDSLLGETEKLLICKEAFERWPNATGVCPFCRSAFQMIGISIKMLCDNSCMRSEHEWVYKKEFEYMQKMADSAASSSTDIPKDQPLSVEETAMYGDLVEHSKLTEHYISVKSEEIKSVF